MNTQNQPLIGKWVSLPDGAMPSVIMDKTCLEFRDDGTLLYGLSSMTEDEQVSLHYSPTETSLLIHHPGEEEDKQVPFKMTNDGMLLLSLGSMPQLYMRSAGVH